MKASELRKLIREEVRKMLSEENVTTSVDDNILFNDLPAVTLHIENYNGRDVMVIKASGMWHDDSNGKVAVLKKNPQLRAQVVQTLQQELQQIFRKTVHTIAGEPFGLKEKTA
jgi:hypothetical protein